MWANQELMGVTGQQHYKTFGNQTWTVCSMFKLMKLQVKVQESSHYCSYDRANFSLATNLEKPLIFKGRFYNDSLKHYCRLPKIISIKFLLPPAFNIEIIIIPTAVVPDIQTMQNTPTQETNLSWTCVQGNRLMWTPHFLRKMASGRKGSGVQLIQRLWETDSRKVTIFWRPFIRSPRRLEGM